MIVWFGGGRIRKFIRTTAARDRSFQTLPRQMNVHIKTICIFIIGIVVVLILTPVGARTIVDTTKKCAHLI